MLTRRAVLKTEVAGRLVWRSKCLRVETTKLVQIMIVKKKTNRIRRKPCSRLLLLMNNQKDVFLKLVEAVCCIYEEYFCNLHRTNKLLCCEDLTKIVCMLLCDTLYMLHSRHELLNSGPDTSNAKSTDMFGLSTQKISKRGDYGHIFSYQIQFAFW